MKLVMILRKKIPIKKLNISNINKGQTINNQKKKIMKKIMTFNQVMKIMIVIKKMLMTIIVTTWLTMKKIMMTVKCRKKVINDIKHFIFKIYIFILL